MEPILRNYLLAGLVSSAVAVFFANVYHGIFYLVTGRSFEQLNFVSITATAFLLPLLAALFYYLAARFTTNAAVIFVTAGVIALFLAVLVTTVAPRSPGFATASIPLQIIVALSTLMIMPIMIRPNEQLTKTNLRKADPPEVPRNSEIPHQVPSSAHFPPETGIPD